MTTRSEGAVVLPMIKALVIAISPQGALRLDVDPEVDKGMRDAAAVARIEAAFGRGPGHGLLQLGLAEVETELSPSLGYFRDFSRRFVTRLCKVPGLGERRGTVEVASAGEDFAELTRAAPPMKGAEYLDAGTFRVLWAELGAALDRELAAQGGSVQDFLQGRAPRWNLVGRICLHLAENKRDEDRPFAFVATYTIGLMTQQFPLSRALQESLAAPEEGALLALLTPIQKAAESSPLVRGMVDSGEIFHPLAWTTQAAYRFLKEIPVLESAGVVVRVPDWWRGRRAARPEVQVTIGAKQPSKVGADALLDFQVGLSLDGEPITDAEWAAIQAATEGLALVRGRWVEIDQARLTNVLKHWRSVEQSARQGGLTFAEAMRLVTGAALEPRGGATTDLATQGEWSKVVAGEWFSKVLAELKNPAGADPGVALKATLRPYQRVGVAWLRTISGLGLGGCLADDMGLGKTIQILALLLIRKRESGHGPSLLVVPASLIANWRDEAQRFTPSLRVCIAHTSAAPQERLLDADPRRLAEADLVVTSYGSLHRIPWLKGVSWDLAVLDEAQAIKNPATRQARAAKELKAKVRFALSGTPVENRLGDLWSIFDFTCPGLLGSAKTFSKFAKGLADSTAPNPYAPLRGLIAPYLQRRLNSDKSIIADLTEKTELHTYCSLTKQQATLYQQAVEDLRHELDKERSREDMARRGLILATLMSLKQICNHPSQWLHQEDYAFAESGKFGRLRELCEEIAERQDKVLVFSQFREMTGPLARVLGETFGSPGLVLHGGTPVKARKDLVARFQAPDGPPFFVLTLKAGGAGLNLTAAAHVIHFDRWWNPAVENQATDRAFRIGQKKNVLVHKFICRGTVEEKVNDLIESKKGLAENVVGGGGEVLLTELGDKELIALINLDLEAALAEA